MEKSVQLDYLDFDVKKYQYLNMAPEEEINPLEEPHICVFCLSEVESFFSECPDKECSSNHGSESN